MAALKAAYPSYEAFRLAHPQAVVAAFRYADKDTSQAPSDELFAALHEAIEAETESVTENTTGNNAKDSELSRAVDIQQRIATLTMTAIIGHESFHLEGERCPLTTLSFFEENGVFEHVLKIQTTGQLFKASFPDPMELAADRCALRQLERIGSLGIGDARNPTSDEYFARRVAADMVAFQTLVGFRRFESLPSGTYPVVDLDQYFRPALRIILLAGIMTDSQTSPALCGEAAELFVQGVQFSYQASPGEGQVSDELLGLLPNGVEAAWNGGAWTADSVTCEPDQISN